MPRDRQIVVLVSGRGRNLQALIDARHAGRFGRCDMTVLSNRPDAQALTRANQAGLKTRVIAHRAFPDRAAFDAALMATLEGLQPDLVVLAGFMRILGPELVTRFLGRMINVHPSLLPRHPGLDTHQRAIDAGDREHGASVHFVTPELDGGPVIIQGRVSVQAQDTSETLAARVMTKVETRILPQAVAWILDGQVRLGTDGIAFNGQALAAPLQLDSLSENLP